MDEQELIELAKKNIWQALKDYHAHTDLKDVYNDVSDSFVDRLAQDSVSAKKELRELFRKSPVWNEELQALVINGTRTHDPDYNLIDKLAKQILYTPMGESKNKYLMINRAIGFFSWQDEDKSLCIEAIKELAPKAYAEGKKPSRIFKALCTALGVVDERAGSEFQKLYAQFADELTTRQIGFKLFVSINPAHFITMSNPKEDDRGCTLTSCHSFNSTEYEYNCGCAGYARDKNTFIVFTTADPNDPETLNNRKTTRQIFAYMPDNGVLLQSRLYNTQGGTTGAQEESRVYRDLIQREISALEDVPNLWKTYSATSEEVRYCVQNGGGFGGYADWTYDHFDGKISIRNDHEDDYETLRVGTYGLCICCGEDTNYGLYCNDCGDDSDACCDDCGHHCHEDDLTRVRDSRGDEIYVCDDCLDRYYSYCDCCEEYYPNDCITYADGEYYCDDCLEENCMRCAECGEWHRDENMFYVKDENGDEVTVCDYCREHCYTECDCCGGYVHDSTITVAYGENGSKIDVCKECLEEKFECCEKCDEWYASTLMKNGCCENCWSEVEEREVETA